MGSIEPMFIRLATGSDVISDSIYSVPLLFSDVSVHATNQHVTCRAMSSFQYDIVLGMDWL